MRSGVGAICILDFAVRVVVPGFFFAVVEDELDFTGVTGFFACEEEALVDFTGDFAFAVVGVDVVAVACAKAAGAIAQIHKPLANNSSPAARRIIVCRLTNAPR
jgi:hypothetical protein